jgi:hypothetical protein
VINWREKLVAFAIHFLLTALLAASAAALIFLVWFPDPFQTMVGGTELFTLVVGCDLVLGPLLSLVIYNSRKSRRKLVMDYGIVGVIQIAALVYGVWVVAGARPAYVAFSKDRLEVVTAREITAAELAAGRDPRYGALPWAGPRHVFIEVPASERQDAMFQSLVGNDEHKRPRFFVPYEERIPVILGRARKLETLTTKFPATKSRIDAAVQEFDLPPDRLRWLAAHHSKGFWMAVVDAQTGWPVGYLPFDTYDGTWEGEAN